MFSYVRRTLCCTSQSLHWRWQVCITSSCPLIKPPCATRVRQLSTTTVACNRWQSYLVDAIPHPEAARPKGDGEKETPRCVSSSLQTTLLPADRRLPRPAVGARMLQEQLHVQGELSTAVRAPQCWILGVVVSYTGLFCFVLLFLTSVITVSCGYRCGSNPNNDLYLYMMRT